jgi:hypothetical protein
MLPVRIKALIACIALAMIGRQTAIGQMAPVAVNDSASVVQP